MSTSNNPPGSLSTTYTDNLGADAVLCRSGALSFTGVHFPGGAVTPQVNDFGLFVPLAQPYVLPGSRATADDPTRRSSCGSAYLDTLGSPYAQALGVSSYTQATGWYSQGLISMKLEFSPPDVGASYCVATANSTGAPAAIAAGGSASVAANDLVLTATGQPDQPGIFIAAPAPTQAPLFNGFLCVSPQGLQRFSLVATPSQGELSEVVDLATSAPGGLTVTPGQPYYFQRWFRDPAAGGAAANFTDGVEVLYVP